MVTGHAGQASLSYILQMGHVLFGGFIQSETDLWFLFNTHKGQWQIACLQRVFDGLDAFFTVIKHINDAMPSSGPKV